MSLEQILVKSMRLAQSWQTQSFHIISYMEIPLDGETDGKGYGHDLIGGRWFIVCQARQQLVLYDVNSNIHIPQILWVQEKKIGFWSKCAIPVKAGQWVIYVRIGEANFTLSYVVFLQECCVSGYLYFLFL